MVRRCPHKHRIRKQNRSDRRNNKYAEVHVMFARISADLVWCSLGVYTFWWGMTGMGESILGVAVGTGAGRLDL